MYADAALIYCGVLRCLRMHIILRNQDGMMLEGLLLAAGRSRMRVAMPDSDDVVELRYKNNHWTFADGRLAELEATFSGSGTNVICLDSHARRAA